MRVSLIDFTGCGRGDPARHAANVLVFTKATRLQMNPDLFSEIEKRDWMEIKAELQYMTTTIPSSHEFCHYTFLINGVSRAFTHQFVRTRTGSYAQQTMRVLDVSGFDYVTGPTIDDDFSRREVYKDTMAEINRNYQQLIGLGAKIEDARGLLPTNICTNIVASFNLRTICELVRKRSSSRTQNEYRAVLDAMKAEVIRVHHWADMFLERDFDKAAGELEDDIRALNLPESHKVRMVKLVDQMRQL